MREAGGEYGTTTGRARRVGWIDLVALRYAARLNTLTHLAITKLDVLSGLGPLRVCTRYRSAERGELRPTSRTTRPCCTTPAACTRSCPAGTRTSRSAATEEELPQAARDYLAYMSDFVGVPIALISVGPGRDQVIWTDAGRATAPFQRAAARLSPAQSCTTRVSTMKSCSARFSSSHSGHSTSARLASPNVSEPAIAEQQRLDGDLAQHREAERHRLARWRARRGCPTAMRPSVLPFVRAIISGA